MRMMLLCASLVCLGMWLVAGSSPGAAAVSESAGAGAGVTDPSREASDTLDALIDARAVKAGIQPAGLVDDDAFLRRVTVDLIGRIPTIEEREAFHRLPQAGRRDAWVDRMLSHPRFVDRWTVFFDDLFRVRQYAEGGDRLRAFVREAIREGKPYHTMVRQMLSASGSVTQNPAAAFLIAEEVEPFELAGAVTQNIMGIRMKCAQCHDHPYDEWTQKDFYAVAAYFSHTRLYKRERPYYVAQVVGSSQPQVRWPPREDATGRRGMEPDWPFAYESIQRDRLAQAIQQRDVARTLEAEVFDESLLNPDSVPDGPFSGVAADLDAASSDMARSAGRVGHEQLREELADLVTRPENPYFAWNLVNRLWAELIGKGIVDPIDDFRVDNPPSHRELLDHLAASFIAANYDVRSIIRTIVLSRAYQREAVAPGASPDVLREGRDLFAVGHVRRMRAEAMYDSIVIAGHLGQAKHPPGVNVRTRTYQVRVLEPVEPEATMAMGMTMTGDSADPTMAASQADAAEQARREQEMARRAAEQKRLQERIERERVRQGLAMVDQKGELNIGFLDDGDDLRDERVVEIAVNELVPAEVLREQEERARQAAALRAEREGRFRFETRTETVDDNPVFGSAHRMRTPAPSDHFLRQFGQPGRAVLGEKRFDDPSLRQALMLMNGRLINEAARVGQLEPMFMALRHPQADAAIRLAYLQTLTREPTGDELSQARSLVEGSPDRAEAIADLRWALMNSHAFRFLP